VKTGAAIAVESVSKSFRIYRRRETTLKETILRGRRGEWEELRAADNLSFTVPTGQALGIIGPNGAGKSTLLKLLARILTPDSGRIVIDGRVSALLELGAGFHPEYSAIENIFLSGAFYGLSRAQLKPRVASIIEFAELGRFADNAVKTYSSGMYARLGFAIAVSVEPDVLLCDEVLAVGDESFRQRCYERMLEFRDAGRTVVLVTHDLGAVHQFCDRAIWLQRGSVQRDGEPRAVVRAYLREVNAGDEAASELSTAARPGAAGSHTPLNAGVPIILHAMRVTAADGADRSIYENGETLRIEVGYHARSAVRSPICEVEVHRHDGTHVATSSTYTAGYETGDVLEGHGRFIWQLEDLRLTPGSYYLSPVLRDHSGVHVLDRHERWVRLQVREGRYLEHEGCVVLPGSWDIDRA
jgi:ABC-type polysaccharide/polyol phosphate transport system ATPase subunit